MKYLNKHNLPKSLCRALMGDEYDLNKIDKSLRIYSATGLIKPVRQSELTKRHWDELETDVSEGLNRLLGSGIHKALEMSKEQDDIIREKRMFLDFNTGEVFSKVEDFKDKSHIYIAAKPDIYDVTDRAIEDFKSSSVWTVVFMNNKGGNKEKWEQQLNIYSYIMRKAGFPVEKLRVIAILKDWMKSKTIDFDYPKNPFQVIDIDVWEDEKTEKFIKEKVEERVLSEVLGDDALPICTVEERWGSGTKYAVMVKAKKRALRVFDNKKDADVYALNVDPSVAPKDKVYVATRHGEDKNCMSYCGLGNLCSYYRENYSEKEAKDGE